MQIDFCQFKVYIFTICMRKICNKPAKSGIFSIVYTCIFFVLELIVEMYIYDC